MVSYPLAEAAGAIESLQELRRALHGRSFMIISLRARALASISQKPLESAVAETVAETLKEAWDALAADGSPFQSVHVTALAFAEQTSLLTAQLDGILDIATADRLLSGIEENAWHLPRFSVE